MTRMTLMHATRVLFVTLVPYVSYVALRYQPTPTCMPRLDALYRSLYQSTMIWHEANLPRIGLHRSLLIISKLILSTYSKSVPNYQSITRTESPHG
jgi:hypothetical protein